MFKLLTVNIEGNKHLEERLFSLFEVEKPDVVCLQEVFEVDVELIRKKLGLKTAFFIPMTVIDCKNIHMETRGKFGLAIFANHIIAKNHYYYEGDERRLPSFFENKNPNAMNRILQVAKINVAKGEVITVANTHFTWSGKGKITNEQIRSFTKLQDYLNLYPEVILCGDFNTPRGREIYTRLSSYLTDNIPQDVTTTIDSNLHKSGKNIQLVVDVLFTSKAYQATNVRVLDNTSDHMAIVANINFT